MLCYIKSKHLLLLLPPPGVVCVEKLLKTDSRLSCFLACGPGAIPHSYKLRLSIYIHAYNAPYLYDPICLVVASLAINRLYIFAL